MFNINDIVQNKENQGLELMVSGYFYFLLISEKNIVVCWCVVLYVILILWFRYFFLNENYFCKNYV